MFTAGMEFDLGEDVNALRDTVHRWAQGRVKPLAAQTDRDNAFPNELWPEMGEMGLLGITVPRNSAAAAWAIWPMSSPPRRSPAPRPRSA